ncbi:hypothetical protein BVRB_029380, partial [Beta vulgaris subsp. vulgaris]
MSSSSVVAQSSDLYEVDIDDEPRDDEEDVEAMKRRVREMEEEAAKIEATIAANNTEA